MADAQQYTFTQARARLEEIVTQVRRKDVSLEKSLDMLEEGVRLANACTELIDHTEWRAVAAEQAAEGVTDEAAAPEGDAEGADAEPTAGSSDSKGDASDEVVAQAHDADADADADVELFEVAAAEVAVVEIDEDGVAHVDVTEVEFFAEADDAWPDDDVADAHADDEPAGV